MKNKTKTLRAAKKRFKISASGHVVRRQSGMRHILTKKSPQRKRNLKAAENLNICDLKRLPRMLPNK